MFPNNSSVYNQENKDWDSSVLEFCMCGHLISERSQEGNQKVVVSFHLHLGCRSIAHHPIPKNVTKDVHVCIFFSSYWHPIEYKHKVVLGASCSLMAAALSKRETNSKLGT